MKVIEGKESIRTADNGWDYFWYAVPGLLLGLLFVVWPISAWLGRKKRRKELRELMGPAYADYKSRVRMAGVSVQMPKRSNLP
jgi:protein-S-isoprenylcysteine O-methyltransferase Ste14